MTFAKELLTILSSKPISIYLLLSHITGDVLSKTKNTHLFAHASFALVNTCAGKMRNLNWKSRYTLPKLQHAESHAGRQEIRSFKARANSDEAACFEPTRF